MNQKPVKQIKFNNHFPNFNISGTAEYKDGEVELIEIDTDCAAQICSTPVDFYPEWSMKDGKIILTLTPKWIEASDD